MLGAVVSLKDDDDIIYNSQSGIGVCNGTYFAIHDGVVGMHGCVSQSIIDPGGGGIVA